jgi:hypothetical protein
MIIKERKMNIEKFLVVRDPETGNIVVSEEDSSGRWVKLNRLEDEKADNLYSHLKNSLAFDGINVNGSLSKLMRCTSSDGILPGVSKVTADGQTVILVTSVDILTDTWYGKLNTEVDEDTLRGVWGCLRFKLERR